MTEFNAGRKDEYDSFAHTLGGGVVDGFAPQLIDSDESPRAKNIEFNRVSLVSTNGARKFGNQSAPGSGWRTRVPPSLPPLFIESGKSVPARGHAQIPYDDHYDIGGRFDFEGTFPSSDVYHVRRGRTFTLELDFALPPEEKLFEAESRGASAPTADPANFTPPHKFDEALDECTLIFQKGGERTSLPSFALGIVNIGQGVGTTAPANRPSNYALVLMWYDAPRWGRYVPGSMKYNLTSGQHPTSGGASQFCTQALRAVVIHHFIEPGRTYNVGVALKMDTGTAGTTSGGGSNTSWNNDGSLTVCVVTDGDVSNADTYQIAAVAGGGVTSGPMDVYKGPTDSLEYLLKYGVRFAGRNLYRWGLGYRFHPWRKCGFIPFGEDGAPLEGGGFRMLDRSNNSLATVYGGSHTLAIWKVNNGDAFVRVNHRGFSHLNTDGGQAPSGTLGGGGAYVEWEGLGGFSGTTTNFNPQALRGYRLVTDSTFASGAPLAKGAVLSILSYADNTGTGGGFEATVDGGATINAFANAGAPAPVFISAFRWHQRELLLGQLKIWGVARDYTNDPITSSRTRLSLASTVRLDDPTEPDITDLLGYWRGDDAGGTVIRELVVGGARSAFMAPLGLGVVDGGTRGSGQLFLSGEGEALTFDFSSNPILVREMERMLQSPKQGFAIEITVRFPEAFYGVQSTENLPDISPAVVAYRPRFAPEIATWDVKLPAAEGFRSTIKPMIALTARGLSNDMDPTRFLAPLGFQLEVLQRSDQDGIDPICPSEQLSWYTSGGTRHNRYDLDAAWVGKTVTLQFGVQPNGLNPNIYEIYLALKPKRDFLPENGDAGDAEMIYCREGYPNPYDGAPTYFIGDFFYLQPKDLARSVITIGGRWNPKPIANATVALGYSEMNCPLIVDEVRVFGTCAPGLLPPSSGATSIARKTVATRDGKLEGARALPARELDDDDLLEPVGGLLRLANVTARSKTVTPPAGARFFTAAPRDTRESVQQCFLLIQGDEFQRPREETLPNPTPEFYLVDSVAADGSSLTLANEFNGATRSNARAGVFRVIGYTSFADKLSPGVTVLPAGKAYNPATATAADVVLSEELWANKAVPGGGWRIRLYGLGLDSREILPSWGRGLSIPRRGKPGEGILGVTTRDDAIFAAVRGAIYQADHRWRDHGPIDELPHSIEMRARRDMVSNIAFPLHSDRIEFANIADEVSVRTDMRAFDLYAIDAWMRFDSFAEYQTVLWIGSLGTHPALTAGTHRVSLIVRLNRGRPEFVLGSTARYQAAAPSLPEKGLFIAQGATTLPLGVDVHVRWVICLGPGATNVLQPWCFVNGKLVSSSVNAVDLDMPATHARDWLQASKLVSASADDTVLVGVARDSFKANEIVPAFTSGLRQLRPQRLHGFMHSLQGSLARLSVSIDTLVPHDGSTPPNFDPTLLQYGNTTVFDILGPNAEGVGHRVKDHASGRSGLIRSSPFISLFHEFGRSTEQAAFATFGNQVFAVNGERIVTIIDGEGMPLGVLPPATPLDFALQRETVWEADNRNNLADQDGDLNDPLRSAARSDALNRFHHRASGNTYLQHTLEVVDQPKMRWQAKRAFHTKGLWRPDSVSGRVSIWRHGGKEKGGPFVECRDGYLVIGWFDLALKREVYVRTSKPVFRPGKLYYINVRKFFPQRDSIEGNWMNTVFGNGRIRRLVGGVFPTTPWVVGQTVTWNAGVDTGIVVRARSTAFDGDGAEIITNGVGVTSPVSRGATSLANDQSGFTVTRPMYDIAVVREFRTQNTAPIKDFQLDAITDGHDLLRRNFLSFTTADAYNVPGTTVTGYIGPFPGARATGGAAGLVTFTTPGNSAAYDQKDWIGMLFQWEGSSLNTEVYRVTAVGGGAGSNFTVQNVRTGAFDNMAAVVNKEFGIFTGISLVKSEGFDLSKTPDAAPYNVEMMGCSDQGNELSGFAPHHGRGWCPAYGMTDLVATNEDARCFENLDTTRAAGAAANDPGLVGTDGFLVPLWKGATGAGNSDVGRLRVDDGKAVYCADCMNYAGLPATYQTTQPSETLKWTRDPHGTAVTPTCTVSSDPIVQATQAGALWAGQRYIAVAFYDPRQNITSNPGPILRIKPASEDISNPAGMVRILLRNLPPPRDRGPLEHRIYESLSGGTQSTLQLVATIAAGSREIAVAPTEETIARGEILDQTNGEPPQARLIAVAQSRLIAAALTELEQLDGLIPSKAYQPGQFVYAKAAILNTGRGSAITGLAELDGQLYAFKRDSLFSCEVDADGNVFVRPISGAPGCVSHQSISAGQHVLVWRGERGVYTLQRGEATDLGQARFISKRLEGFFTDVADLLAGKYSSAALNRRREQYVLSIKARDEYLQRRRISMAVMGERPIFSTYEDPAICALANVQENAADARQLIGGCEFGFMWWLDRDGELHNGLGVDASDYGAAELKVDGGLLSRTTAIPLAAAGVVDTDLEGARGLKVRWGDGESDWGWVLSSVDSILHLDRPAVSLTPGTSITLGAQEFLWESKWYDFTAKERSKRPYFLDLEIPPGGSGVLLVEFLGDMDEEQVLQREELPLSSRLFSIPIRAKFKRWYKVRIRSKPLTAGVKFEITSLTWRTGKTGQS